LADHCAYNVASEFAVNVPMPASYVVPKPFAEVFQPAKLYPVLANVPEFDATVKPTPYVFVCELGTEPDDAEFEL
jgi:hypothetical protein